MSSAEHFKNLVESVFKNPLIADQIFKHLVTIEEVENAIKSFPILEQVAVEYMNKRHFLLWFHAHNYEPIEYDRNSHYNFGNGLKKFIKDAPTYTKLALIFLQNKITRNPDRFFTNDLGGEPLQTYGYLRQRVPPDCILIAINSEVLFEHCPPLLNDTSSTVVSNEQVPAILTIMASSFPNVEYHQIFITNDNTINLPDETKCMLVLYKDFRNGETIRTILNPYARGKAIGGGSVKGIVRNTADAEPISVQDNTEDRPMMVLAFTGNGVKAASSIVKLLKSKKAYFDFLVDFKNKMGFGITAYTFGLYFSENYGGDRTNNFAFNFVQAFKEAFPGVPLLGLITDGAFSSTSSSERSATLDEKAISIDPFINSFMIVSFSSRRY